MEDKSFFKPTNLYKEYMILDLIEKNKDITQRELATHLGVAVSMVNLLLDRIEKEGFIKRKKYTSKTVEYILTKKGIERRLEEEEICLLQAASLSLSSGDGGKTSRGGAGKVNRRYSRASCGSPKRESGDDQSVHLARKAAAAGVGGGGGLDTRV